MRINASDVSLAREPGTASSILNVIPGMIDDLQDAGPARLLVRLVVGQEKLLAMITRRSAQQLDLRPGLELYAQIKSVALL